MNKNPKFSERPLKEKIFLILALVLASLAIISIFINGFERITGLLIGFEFLCIGIANYNYNKTATIITFMTSLFLIIMSIIRMLIK